MTIDRSSVSRRNPNPESPPEFLDEQLVLAPATTRHSAATDAALSAQERDSKAPLVSALAAAASRSEYVTIIPVLLPPPPPIFSSRGEVVHGEMDAKKDLSCFI
ncbi:hypothetical protein BHM03_00042223 [Ensete ventricosum]|nr:hypothetical protein BHM03_00042223 [Ensete ventricosum]